MDTSHAFPPSGAGKIVATANKKKASRDKALPYPDVARHRARMEKTLRMRGQA